MRTVRIATAAGLAAVLAGGAATAAAADPGTPGQPQAGRVVFHEDFQNAPATGLRTMLSAYVGANGETYTADPYWMNAVKANGMVLSFKSTPAAKDATGAGNGTETVAFNTLRQLAEALGKVNGSANPQTNLAISAYTQDSKTAKNPDDQVMLATNQDITLKDAQGRFLAFSVNAAATNGKNKAHPDRENPQLKFAVVRDGKEQALTSTPIDPITDSRSRVVAVTATNPQGASEPVYAGRFTSDKSFLYDGGSFGIVVRNGTSANMGNDGAFDDIEVVDVTPQLDKSFSERTATTGDSVRLTLTVTNTDELAAKAGWSFTDSLPSGLVIAENPRLTTTCDAEVTAAAGSGAIAVKDGALAAADKSCTVSVDVTSDTAGTYSNGADNITVRRGLDAPDTATVTFKDAAAGDLVVRYVDRDGNPLAPADHSTGAPGAEYTTAPKDVDGWQLVQAELPSNASGVYTDGTTTVVYVYERVPAPATGTVVAHFVDTDGNRLTDDASTSGPVDDDYATTPADVPGYHVVVVHGDETGKYVDGTVEVTYVYERDAVTPATGDVVAHYVDTKGSTLSGDVTGSGPVGDDYATKPARIPGYHVVVVQGDEKGRYVDGTIVVTYVYERDADPVKPVKPVTPVEPVKPVTPVKPMTLVKPVHPVTPKTPLVPQTHVVADPGATAPTGRLASTGSEGTALFAAIAGGLVAAGALTVLYAKRRTQQ
ncbi:MucBP domain-containing protein [Cellulomonas alba]|uniref:MucBP domain-containing protein n=1 Tax=Cellulomonas alba TaxID=3053467 RepID=A0ABT7SH64_9CELL|nr:MucBP domain-containing protein [Cellulomonas alba]MDM7855513.1 MucBP domain-containing protein [Cellulomonas alba]